MAKAGRPRKYPTAESMSKVLDDFIQNTPKDQLTLTGMCLALDMTKVGLSEYEKRDEYKDIIAMCKLRVEHSYELALRTNPNAGNIFALKNFGWRDSQHITGEGIAGNTSVINVIRPERKMIPETNGHSPQRHSG